MDVMQAEQLRRQCAARVLARTRPAVERRVPVHPGIGIDHLMALRVEGTPVIEPATVGEWLDDLCSVALQGGRGPWIAVLAEIAEGCRDGERAAVAAISGARKLSQWDQWHLYCELERWRTEARKLPAARSLMSSLVRSWERARGLADERPGYSELPELPDPPGPRVLEYPTKWGTPAGMAY
jgi:hypothetical protein